jgi:hypothetical protein
MMPEREIVNKVERRIAEAAIEASKFLLNNELSQAVIRRNKGRLEVITEIIKKINLGE